MHEFPFYIAILNGTWSLHSTITVKTFWLWSAININAKNKNKKLNHHVCRQLAMESPHDANRRRYFSSDLIYMVINSNIFSGVTPRNLTAETFVKIKSRIVVLSNAFFWLEIMAK